MKRLKEMILTGILSLNLSACSENTSMQTLNTNIQTPSTPSITQTKSLEDIAKEKEKSEMQIKCAIAMYNIDTGQNISLDSKDPKLLEELRNKLYLPKEDEKQEQRKVNIKDNKDNKNQKDTIEKIKKTPFSISNLPNDSYLITQDETKLYQDKICFLNAEDGKIKLKYTLVETSNPEISRNYTIRDLDTWQTIDDKGLRIKRKIRRLGIGINTHDRKPDFLVQLSVENNNVFLYTLADEEALTALGDFRYVEAETEKRITLEKIRERFYQSKEKLGTVESFNTYRTIRFRTKDEKTGLNIYFSPVYKSKNEEELSNLLNFSIKLPDLRSLSECFTKPAEKQNITNEDHPSLVERLKNIKSEKTYVNKNSLTITNGTSITFAKDKITLTIQNGAVRISSIDTDISKSISSYFNEFYK